MPNMKKQLARGSLVILLTETKKKKKRSEKFQLSLTLAQLIIMDHNIKKTFTFNQKQTLHCYNKNNLT